MRCCAARRAGDAGITANAAQRAGGECVAASTAQRAGGAGVTKSAAHQEGGDCVTQTQPSEWEANASPKAQPSERAAHLRPSGAPHSSSGRRVRFRTRDQSAEGAPRAAWQRRLQGAQRPARQRSRTAACYFLCAAAAARCRDRPKASTAPAALVLAAFCPLLLFALAATAARAVDAALVGPPPAAERVHQQQVVAPRALFEFGRLLESIIQVERGRIRVVLGNVEPHHARARTTRDVPHHVKELAANALPLRHQPW
eukprot:247251-Chlamydomonas_euryale.AAC.6